MKLRIICREDDGWFVFNAGASALSTSYRTFDVQADGELADWLRAAPQYAERCIVGVEVCDEEPMP